MGNLYWQNIQALKTFGYYGGLEYIVECLGFRADTNSINPIYWLVVWNINFIFPYIGKFITPTDELIFFRGVGQPPTGLLIYNGIPFGKHTKNYGKSPFLIGKSTISRGHV